MNLIALPAFADNCIWMLHDAVRAVVMDLGGAAPVQGLWAGCNCNSQTF